jgi:hypothetical protein
MNIKNNENNAPATAEQLGVKLHDLQWSLESLGATERLAQRVLIEGVQKQIRELPVPIQS